MFKLNLKLTIRPVFCKNENSFSQGFHGLMCVEQKVSCSCTCPPNSFERSDHIVFGFPNRARARFLVQSAPLGWHKSMALCRSCRTHCTSRMTCVAWGSTPTHSVRNVPARWGLCTSFSCARTIWGNPKLWPLRSNACAFLWHLHFLFHTTDHEGLGP